MRTMFVTLILFCFVVAAPAADSQDKKPEPPKPAATPAPETLQVKVLKAKLAVKDAESQMANLNVRWQQVQAAAKEIQSDGPGIQQKVSAAQTDLNKAKEETLKAMGLDPAKYDFDDSAMIASPKATPAPATPSPEKK
jgi:hypothetical protein